MATVGIAQQVVLEAMQTDLAWVQRRSRLLNPVMHSYMMETSRKPTAEHRAMYDRYHEDLQKMHEREIEACVSRINWYKLHMQTVG